MGGVHTAVRRPVGLGIALQVAQVGGGGPGEGDRVAYGSQQPHPEQHFAASRFSIWIDFRVILRNGRLYLTTSKDMSDLISVTNEIIC